MSIISPNFTIEQRPAAIRHGPRGRRRSGLTSMIAMLYLVLISTLAVGFYSMTTISAQVAGNDGRVAKAYMAASSGMDFMRRQLARVSVPPGTEGKDAIKFYYPNLQALLNGSDNLGGHTIGRDGFVVNIPAADDQYINLDPDGNTRFRATINDWDGEIVVTSYGYSGKAPNPVAVRAITMDYSRKPHDNLIFKYAIASKGQIQMDKGEINALDPKDSAVATLFSAKASGVALNVTGGIVGGKLNLLDGANVNVTGGKVDGATSPAEIMSDKHTLYHETSPDFPDVDPTVFKKYATNAYVAKSKTQQNILIKAGTNPKFNANDVVQGIMYIESPNQVTFNGNFTLQGFIVMDKGVSTTDSLTFSGNLAQAPVPAGKAFDSVRATSGVAILAPNAAVLMTGSTNSNLKGSVSVDTFHFKGSADIQIDRGTLMTLNPNDKSAWFEGKTVKFTASGLNNAPTIGISYSAYYSPDTGTWQEPTQQ